DCDPGLMVTSPPVAARPRVMRREWGWESVPEVLVAVTVKLKVPDAVGVPEIAPVAAFRVSPVGRAPAVTANVAAGNASAVTTWEKGEPTGAARGGPEVISGA